MYILKKATKTILTATSNVLCKIIYNFPVTSTVFIEASLYNQYKQVILSTLRVSLNTPNKSTRPYPKYQIVLNINLHHTEIHLKKAIKVIDLINFQNYFMKWHITDFFLQKLKLI